MVATILITVTDTHTTEDPTGPDTITGGMRGITTDLAAIILKLTITTDMVILTTGTPTDIPTGPERQPVA